MLIQNLLNEATKKTPKKDYTNFAPEFDITSRDSYDRVVKYLRILGHAEHLDRVDVKAAVSSKGVKFDFYIDPHDEDTEEEQATNSKMFWKKVLTYFSKLKDVDVTVGVFKYSNQTPLKDVMKNMSIDDRPIDERKILAITITRKVKPAVSKVDYDELLKTVRKEKLEHFKSVGKSPNNMIAIERRIAKQKEKK